MGRQLKQSVKVFHNLMLNLRLPVETHNHTLLEHWFNRCFRDDCVQEELISTHTHRRTRRCGWWRHTRGCPWARRSSLGIWSCRPTEGRSSPGTASLCPRSRPGKGNLPLEGSHHTQTASADLCTGHGYHLRRGCERTGGGGWQTRLNTFV